MHMYIVHVLPTMATIYTPPDIQLTEFQILTDQYSNLQKTLVRMLQVEWGSNHTYPDHLESSNLCLLCHGMSLWLTLAKRLIIEYVQMELKKQDAGEKRRRLTTCMYLYRGVDNFL